MVKRIGLIGLFFLVWVSVLQKNHSTAQMAPIYAQGAFFIENAGQYAPEIRFQGMTDLGPMLLTADSLWLIGAEHGSNDPSNSEIETATRVLVQLRFRNANPAVTLEPVTRLATSVNYFFGSDQAAWLHDVPTWAGVRYRNLYPGIDLEMVSDAHGHLNRTLVAQPGADLSQVVIDITGVDAITTTSGGVELDTEAGSITLPYLTVVDSLQRRHVSTLGPRLVGTTVYQPFAAAAPSATLSQDDDFIYYYPFGGSGAEWISSVELVTSTGMLYFTGQTFSTNLATESAAYPSFRGGQTDGYLGRLALDGSLRTLSYLGGAGRDYTYDIALDKNGRILLTGYTNSPNFPISNVAMDPILDPATCDFGGTTETCYDAFVSRLSASGQALMESTYLGGNNHDYGYAILDDKASGEILVAGKTSSSNFPTHLTAYDRTLGGGYDAFVTKLNVGLTSLVHSTYYGGGGDEIVLDMELKQNTGQIYISGQTFSSDLSVPSGFDATYGGQGDSFVARFADPLNTLQFGSYLGGIGEDYTNRMFVTALGKAVLVGRTASTDFPIAGQALDASFNGLSDVFYVVVNSTGNALEYSTFWGGNGDDIAYGVDADAIGSILIGGETTSTNLHTTLNAQNRSRIAAQVGFVLKFNPLDANKIYYSSYIAKDSSTPFISIFDIALWKDGSVYLGGYAGSQAFAARLKLDKELIFVPMARKSQ